MITSQIILSVAMITIQFGLQYLAYKFDDNQRAMIIRAFSLIYDEMKLNSGEYRKYKENNKFYCSQKDIYNYQHQDILLKDYHVENNYQEQNSPSALIQKYHFSNVVPKTKRTNLHYTTMELYNDINDIYKYLCVFDKFTRMQKTQQNKIEMAGKQRALIENFKRQNKSRQCIEAATFSLLSYNLNDAKECLQIMEILNSTNITRNKYLFKNNDHGTKGLNFLTENKTKSLLKTFDSGRQCGVKAYKGIIQEYMQNPLLNQGRKIEFRIYLLVVSSNPWISYYYINALATQCLLYYSLNTTKKDAHICNPTRARMYHNSNKTYLGPDVLPMHDVNLRWPFTKSNTTASYKVFKNQDWYDKVFIPKLEMKMAYFLSTFKQNVTKDSRLARLMGFDIALDSKFNVFIHELNSNPNRKPSTSAGWEIQDQLHKEAIELLMLYNRQKYKKIKALIDDVLLPHIKQNRQDEKLSQIIQDALKEKKLPGSTYKDFKFLNVTKILKACHS